MPRRTGTPRKAKYAPTLTRTTDRFVVDEPGSNQ